jgi:predicted RNase H-like nuclease
MKLSETVFIGLDLAWASANNTGATAARWDSTAQKAVIFNWREQTGANDAILAWVREIAPPPVNAIIAIDAPLVVPNVTGARAGDTLLSAAFRRYEAGTHPANRTNLGRYGTPPGAIRGETLANRLVAELDFVHDPYLVEKQPGRRLFECFPHPAMVVLFKLEKTLKYKRKLRKQANDRHAAYAALQQHLARLENATPALTIPPELLTRATRTMRGESLKQYEDLLDSLMCTYIALFYWFWGAAKTTVYGSLTDGYIATPMLEG